MKRSNITVLITDIAVMTNEIFVIYLRLMIFNTKAAVITTSAKNCENKVKNRGYHRNIQRYVAIWQKHLEVSYLQDSSARE